MKKKDSSLKELSKLGFLKISVRFIVLFQTTLMNEQMNYNEDKIAKKTEKSDNICNLLEIQ